jgi:hypothetical protein
LEFLTLPANESAWSLEHLRFDFFRVCGNVFKHGFASKLSLESRKQLLQFALSHCGYGPLSGEQKEKELKLKDFAIEKSKDSKVNVDFEVQFELSVSLVQYWALHVSFRFIRYYFIALSLSDLCDLKKKIVNQRFNNVRTRL